jgi:hypothetical protein
MSNRRVPAILDGYKQFFPDSLNELCNIYHRARIGGLERADVIEIMTTLDLIETPITQDSYHWDFGLIFGSVNNKVAVLFPNAKEENVRNKTQLDRSIGVYAQGNATRQDAEKVLRNIYETLVTAMERQ